MRKKKAKTERMQMVRVICKASDGRLDYMMPRDKAKALYEAGKLTLDLTNGSYAEK